jgi:hypothetical protein
MESHHVSRGGAGSSPFKETVLAIASVWRLGRVRLDMGLVYDSGWTDCEYEGWLVHDPG